MKYYVLTEQGLSSLVFFVHSCNPPEGMTRKEMEGRFNDLLYAIQNGFGGTRTDLRNEITTEVMNELVSKYDLKRKRSFFGWINKE